MSTDNEQELIARIMGGESELFGELIDRYKTGLYYHCFAMLRSEDTAEDITQEAFIQAYRQLKKYNHAYRFSTWLYKIATHRALDYLRRKQPVRLEQDMLDGLVSTLPPTDRRVVHRELHEAVARLAPKYRTAISLHYWHGKSYEEIALIMNAPMGSVKGWLARAKQQLKEALS